MSIDITSSQQILDAVMVMLMCCLYFDHGMFSYRFSNEKKLLSHIEEILNYRCQLHLFKKTANSFV